MLSKNILIRLLLFFHLAAYKRGDSHQGSSTQVAEGSSDAGDKVTVHASQLRRDAITPQHHAVGPYVNDGQMRERSTAPPAPPPTVSCSLILTKGLGKTTTVSLQCGERRLEGHPPLVPAVTPYCAKVGTFLSAGSLHWEGTLMPAGYTPYLSTGLNAERLRTLQPLRPSCR